MKTCLLEDAGKSYFDIPEFLSGMLTHLKKYDFIVSGDTEERFFTLSQEITIETLEDVENILEMLICKGSSESKPFHEAFYAYFYPESALSKKERKKLNNAANTKARLKQSLSYQENRKTECEEALVCAENRMNEFLQKEEPKTAEASRKKLLPKDKKQEKSLKDLSKNDPIIDRILSGNISDMEEAQIKSAFSSFENMLRSAIFKPDAESLMKKISEIKKAFKKEMEARSSYREEKEAVKAGIEKARSDLDNTQKKIDDTIKEMRSVQSLIDKNKGAFHRPEFLDGLNAVTSQELGELGSQNIRSLTKDEKEKLYAYIRKNAIKFYTVMKRNMHTRIQMKMDMPGVVKHACETGGVPMRLYYIKPKPSKPSLTVMLDISGSCRKVSEMMLVFLHYLRHVFKGGFHAYAFVGHIYDITQSVSEPDPKKSISNVIDVIPTRGVYSNYNLMLAEFTSNHMDSINKDSTVLFIGDARNNKNDANLYAVKKIHDKAKRCFWLNTEEHEAWNTGDSIISKYKPYMESVQETVNTNQLIKFLMEMRR